VNDKEKNAKRLEFARGRLGLTEPCYDTNFHIYSDNVVHRSAIIGEKVQLGHGCIIRSGVVIGESGFGFAYDENNNPISFLHTGGVVIGDYVGIWPNCTIMRGTVDDTIIHDHVKIDAMCHIGHNCEIGKGTCIAACTELSGSVKIGEYAWVGPSCCFAQKVKIGKMALIGIGSNVIDDIPDYAVVAGNPAKIRYFHDGGIHPGAIGRRHNGS
jgi:UDP-3-O-[3-hydroxymyristoyl] glucosamine N-acyltransferase